MNNYDVYTDYLNQIFNLLYASKFPSMNLCTTDVILGWKYNLFEFGGNVSNQFIGYYKTAGVISIGNMIGINPTNIINYMKSDKYTSQYDIANMLLITFVHEISHAEQDIDMFRYGQPGFDDYSDYIEYANHFRTLKFILAHKDFIENNINFGGNRIHLNEQQLLSDCNTLVFAENDFVYVEKKKLLFDKLALLDLASTPEQLEIIRNKKNFSIRDRNGDITFIKQNNRYNANYNTFWFLNLLLYNIYGKYFQNGGFAPISSTEDSIVLQTNIPTML